jgi:hypothetical protein
VIQKWYNSLPVEIFWENSMFSPEAIKQERGLIISLGDIGPQI